MQCLLCLPSQAVAGAEKRPPPERSADGSATVAIDNSGDATKITVQGASRSGGQVVASCWWCVGCDPETPEPHSRFEQVCSTA
jgi:hypothetical protein